MGDGIRKGLLVLLFMVLLLPLAQQCLPFVTSGKLYGYFATAPDVEFSMAKWWDGSYQDKKVKYINDHVGFRPDLVRLNNQLDYSLFGKLFNGAVAGKDNYLYDNKYIGVWLGEDYVGTSQIRTTLIKLKALQDTLGRMGKTLVLVHAASKPFYYPEYLPERIKLQPKGMTNYAVCVPMADSLGINQIDFGAWLASMKYKTKETLYTKQGLHWSVYGAGLCVDSLMRYTAKQRQIKMPELMWGETEHTREARATDDDLGKPLNLIIPFGQETYSYPRIDYKEDTTTRKPKMICIGDSFVFPWIYLGVFDHEFANWQFWYYFREVCSARYPHASGSNPAVADINWMDELNKTDCIYLVYTASNVGELGSGFIEQAYAHFYPAKD